VGTLCAPVTRALFATPQSGSAWRKREAQLCAAQGCQLYTCRLDSAQTKEMSAQSVTVRAMAADGARAGSQARPPPCGTGVIARKRTAGAECARVLG